MDEISQRDLVAYIIYSSKEIEKYSEKNIDNYINKLKNNISNTQIGHVLLNINLSLLEEFGYSADLDYFERINYAKLIYYRLLHYADKCFTNKDIVLESKYVYKHFTIRTAAKEVIKLGL